MHHQNGVVNKDVKIRDLFPEWSVDAVDVQLEVRFLIIPR